MPILEIHIFIESISIKINHHGLSFVEQLMEANLLLSNGKFLRFDGCDLYKRDFDMIILLTKEFIILFKEKFVIAL